MSKYRPIPVSRILLRAWEFIAEGEYLKIMTPFVGVEIALNWAPEWFRHGHFKGWRIFYRPLWLYGQLRHGDFFFDKTVERTEFISIYDQVMSRR